jgi:hypothetical protein
VHLVAQSVERPRMGFTITLTNKRKFSIFVVADSILISKSIGNQSDGMLPIHAGNLVW